ncbi:FkbM family methyltransferase [Egibacter rhizosphaerae]|uniref:FkbM family methyltransferase n=1 Tax=Egibacter rhizosphaerae TaxID=1670831 RepID=UPI0013F1634D|nr:FkbM family methyltransferase [Egibacter rhizosphaerae]
MFDIGANVGQSAKAYLDAWPTASIWCFEPVSSSYEALVQGVGGHPQVQVERLALGEAESDAVAIEARRQGVRNRVLDVTGAGNYQRKVPRERVVMCTGDAYCAKRGIQHISFCKVDTEGLDLEVLRGLERMLSANRIDLVQVEAGMNASNSSHVPFEAFRRHLHPRGYRLFSLPGQAVGMWGVPEMRRANPVFVSETVVKAHTRS